MILYDVNSFMAGRDYGNPNWFLPVHGTVDTALE